MWAVGVEVEMMSDEEWVEARASEISTSEEADEAEAHVRTMRRFTREVAIISQLQHPNVVQYIGSTCFYDVTSNSLRGAILMELVHDGLTLETAIEQLASRGNSASPGARLDASSDARIAARARAGAERAISTAVSTASGGKREEGRKRNRKHCHSRDRDGDRDSEHEQASAKSSKAGAFSLDNWDSRGEASDTASLRTCMPRIAHLSSPRVVGKADRASVHPVMVFDEDQADARGVVEGCLAQVGVAAVNRGSE